MLHYEDLINISKEFDVKKADYFNTIKELKILGMSTVYFNNVLHVMEKSAFKQFGHKLLDVKRADSLSVDIFPNTILNHYWNEPDIGNFAIALFMDRMDEENHSNLHKQLLFRCYDNSIVRAVLSNDYGSILNTNLLLSLQPALETVGETFRVADARLDRDTMMVKIIYKEFNSSRKGDEYGGGVYIYNDEVGKHSLRIGTLLKRGFCDNSIVLGDITRLYHRGNIHTRLDNVLPGIAFALQQSEQYIQKIDNLLTFRINFDEEIEKINKKFTLTEDELSAIYTGSEGEIDNAWGLVQGITFMAKSVVDIERRFLLENFAGELLENYTNVQ